MSYEFWNQNERVGTWVTIPLRPYNSKSVCQSQRHMDEVSPDASHLEIIYDIDNEGVKFAKLTWITCDECHNMMILAAKLVYEVTLYESLLKIQTND